MADYIVIGGSPIRKDAYEKVTGEAKYSSDFHPAGMLYAKIKYSDIPHGIIKHIDTSAAEALPGVIIVLTGKDVPAKRGGGYLKDKHILCRERVRFIGDPVAAVAATSEAIAEQAVELIKVEYEELPAVFDPVEAFDKDCKVILHKDLKTYEQAWMVNGAFFMDDERPNQFINRPIIHGDVEKGFAESDVVIEHTYTFPRASHCYLEPDVCVAIPEKDGEITTYSSEQMGSPGKNEICEQFEIPASKVHYNIPYVGGGFGGKTGTPCENITVLLAMRTGKPVRLLHTRLESFINGNPRSSSVIVLKDGYKADGTLIARQMTEYVNGGAYSEHVCPLITCGPYGAVGSYRIPNLRVDCYGIYTNTPPTGPYRGLGGEMICFAVDRNMEYAADALGINSVELRLKNLLDKSRTPPHNKNVEGEAVTGPPSN